MEKQTESKSINLGLIKALFDFQQACPAIKKESTATGTKFSYKYGSLPYIIEVIKPHLKKAGLVYTQPIRYYEGAQYIFTQVYHVESGESIDSTMLLPEVEFASMNVVQSGGAVITYCRRYALMSILGLVTEDDDNDAAGKTKSKSAVKSQVRTLNWLNPKEGGKDSEKWLAAVKYLADGGTILEIKKKYRMSKENEEKLLNQAMTFDDLPFDRMAAEGAVSDGENSGSGEASPGEPNMNFDDQGEPNPY